jgi:hypothetical protein
VKFEQPCKFAFDCNRVRIALPLKNSTIMLTVVLALSF